MPLPIRLILGYAAGWAALAGLVTAACLYFRPSVAVAPLSPARPPGPELAATPDPAHAPVIWRDADYTQGRNASWFPREEAPVLRELVAAGQLPPVADRTGPEPVVLEGIDGPGNYGGTWYRLGLADDDITGVMRTRLSYANLVRWSPNGYPIVPHLAKSWTVSDDLRVYTFTLRRGVRWSDGAAFTTADILYWWRQEALFFNQQPNFMNIGGEQGVIEQVDDLQVRFVFPKPNGMFLERLASAELMPYSPRHYLEKYHPAIGDQKLIAATMAAMQLPGARAVYERMSDVYNPACPRMWPWIYRQYRATPPQSFVRNPYYFAVDPQGRQLPYLDRVVSDVKTKPLITTAAAGGEVSMQARHLEFQDYTLLATAAPRNGYQLVCWYNAARTAVTFFPNLNRRIDPARPATRWKHHLLNERTFRQALSLSINRQEIIDAVYNGIGEPAQAAPGPGSPYHHERLLHSFTSHDPVRAAELLDKLGLARRDHEGFRTFPDGSRMTFFVSTTNAYPPDAVLMVADYWNKAGVRTIIQLHDRSLFEAKAATADYDFLVWLGFDEFMPLIEPRAFVPVIFSSYFAPGYGRWYLFGGLVGNPLANQPGCIAPPVGSDIRRAMELTDQAAMAPSAQERNARFAQVLDLNADNLWTISFATAPPSPVVVRDGFRNVPRQAVMGYFCKSPANTGVETYFWDRPDTTIDSNARLKDAILNPSSLPFAGTAGAVESAAGPARVLGWLAALAALVVLSVRYPFVGRRLLILIPTMAVISVVVFTILELPPGDYISAKTLQLEMEGNASARTQLADLRQAFHFDRTPLERYLYWSGLMWFRSFQPQDTGLLQGNLGRSMENNIPVNELLGDRLALTLGISVLTTLFIWATAVPLGIYAATRQHTWIDYALTLMGFLGMSIPPFLLALVLMYCSRQYFGLTVSGLFSPSYAAQPFWDAGKLVDLLHHVWVPVVVLGASSVAAMMRIMRANLLDELKQPYVTTARAKGLRPLRLLWRYPVRMAVSPFASGMGSLFPQLISGDAIVAIVLSLPTISPLLLRALLNQDTYLAASLLMLLSLLSLFGTLASDLLLMWLDPRIRLTRART